MPKGKPTTKKELKALADLQSVGTTFARVWELSGRYAKLGLKAKWGVFVCATLGCKPWASPTLEATTEADFSKIEAALAAAEKGGANG